MLCSLKKLLNCVGMILIIVGHIVKNVGVRLEIRKKAITVEKDDTISSILAEFSGAVEYIHSIPHEIEQIDIRKQFSIPQSYMSLCAGIRISNSPVL